MDQKVADFLSKSKNWQEELERLRTIILDCELEEIYKWRVPCYTYENKNIVLVNRLRDYCALGFFKGALLNDSEGILFQQTENMQAVRIIKFTSVKEIVKLESTIKEYIYEAIGVERAGLKIDYKKDAELDFPEELAQKLESDVTFKTAFEALTPGRQKGYNLYFSAPKQSKTRASRIEAYTERILNGKGFNDCVCGMSKSYPNCDGSHKYL